MDPMGFHSITEPHHRGARLATAQPRMASLLQQPGRRHQSPRGAQQQRQQAQPQQLPAACHGAPNAWEKNVGETTGKMMSSDI